MKYILSILIIFCLQGKGQVNNLSVFSPGQQFQLQTTIKFKIDSLAAVLRKESSATNTRITTLEISTYLGIDSTLKNNNGILGINPNYVQPLIDKLSAIIKYLQSIK